MPLYNLPENLLYQMTRTGSLRSSLICGLDLLSVIWAECRCQDPYYMSIKAINSSTWSGIIIVCLAKQVIKHNSPNCITMIDQNHTNHILLTTLTTMRPYQTQKCITCATYKWLTVLVNVAIMEVYHFIGWRYSSGYQKWLLKLQPW